MQKELSLEEATAPALWVVGGLTSTHTVSCPATPKSAEGVWRADIAKGRGRGWRRRKGRNEVTGLRRGHTCIVGSKGP